VIAGGKGALRSPSLVEREGEVAQLAGLLQAALAGAGRVVVIEAAAGVGKSRLLTAAREEAEEAGLRVLHARGSELERDFAFGIVRQLFEPALADAQQEFLAKEPVTVAGRLLKGEEHLAGPDSAFRALHAFHWFAAELAAQQPLLFLIDDVHWADDPSLRWLAYLAHRVEGLPALVACALRPLDPGSERLLLTEVLADPATFVLRPTPLSVPAVEVVVRSTLDPNAADAFCKACHEATGGNPLFLHRLLDELAHGGINPTAEHAAVVREMAPPSILRALRLRLSRLEPEATQLAEAVAVLGDEIDLAYAAALARVETEVAAGVSVTLAHADILRLDDNRAASFVHPIVRATIYNGIAAPDREEAHLRAADVLRHGRASAERVAAQLLLTRPRADERTVAVLREAARASSAHGALDVTVRLLERALAEPPPRHARGEVLYELGVAERAHSASNAVACLREAIELLEDPVARAQAAFELGETVFFAGEQRSLVQLLAHEIEHLPIEQADLRHRLEAVLIAVAIEEPSLYPLALERIERLRANLPDESLGGRMLLSILAYHDARAGTSRSDTVAWARQALMSGALDQEGMFPFSAGFALVAADCLEDAEALYERIIVDARAAGSILPFTLASCFRGAAAAVRGDLVRAEADLWQAVEAADASGLLTGVPTAHALLAGVLLERGEINAAAAALERVRPIADVPYTVHLNTYLASRGSLRIAQGHVGEGVADLLEVGQRYEALGGHNPAMFDWRSACIPGLFALGEQAEARHLAGELLALARAWGAGTTLGRALRLAGLAEGGQRGIRLLEEAVTVLVDSPARLEEAKARTELGAALRRANHRAQAREHLRRGLELAHRASARPVEERAHTELLATGARPRRLVLSGVEALTPSERRVAEMAAGGMTNREIAQALFVTPRTVEVHLSAAYRKLGIQSRSELPAELAGVADA
jgi:DNA-binding CsgD family transcriptional regulator